MKIVQTFWSGGKEIESPLKISGGWISPEYHWMSWALSCLLLRRLYDQVELYTDEIGKRILVDILQLPYTDVHVVFDDSFVIHPKLFSLAKIHTYSLQEEPFVHVDGDLFLWKPLPESVMNAGLIASNPEVDLYFNKEILVEMEGHFQYIPSHLKDIYKQEHIFSSNAGIFGGSNIPFIRKYCSEAEQIIKENENCLEKVNIGNTNMLIEQISLFYLAARENVRIVYSVTEPVDHPLYKDYWRFADVPKVPMIHPVGGCKRIPYVIHHLGHRLQMEFPEMYYRIIEHCTSENIKLRNRLYHYLDFNSIGKKNDLSKGRFFKNEVKFSGLEVLKPDSNVSYRRTWLTIAHYFPEQSGMEKELKWFVQQEGMNNLLKEIYFLETQNLQCLEWLFLEAKKGEIYNAELDHYKKTSNFMMNSKWLQKKVTLKKGVRLLKVNRAWGQLNIPEPEKVLVKVLESPENEYCVTLSADLFTLSIHEAYHEELDAIIITLIENPMRIEDILKDLTTYFEEEIEISNPHYQLLIFDVLKRLAFENIISIYV